MQSLAKLEKQVRSMARNAVRKPVNVVVNLAPVVVAVPVIVKAEEPKRPRKSAEARRRQRRNKRLRLAREFEALGNQENDNWVTRENHRFMQMRNDELARMA